MKLFEKYSKISRNKKYELFLRLIKPKPNETILDVGAGSGTFLENKYHNKKKIISLDISEKLLKEIKIKYPEIKTIKASALKLPFKTKSIDIVFSNAVIEHVGDKKKYKKFSKEIQRVGKRWFVTTPNKWFPFEPHYRLPLYQFVPKKIQKIFSRFFKIGRYKRNEWEDIHLLSAKEMKEMFPTSKLILHKVTILPETIICYGGKLK